MNHRHLLVTVISLLSLATTCWSNEQIVFRDDFVAPGATGVNPEFKTSSDKPSGPPYLACRPATNSLLYPSWNVRGTRGPVVPQSFELSFRFRIPTDGGKAFDVLLLYGEGKVTQSVRFGLTGCSSHGVPNQNMIQIARGSGWAAYGLSDLQAGEWCRAVIRVAGPEFVVFLDRDGVMRRMATGEIPGAPYGFNINTLKAAVDLSDLSVREIEPPPAAMRTVAGLQEAQSFVVTNILVTDGIDRVSFYLREGTGQPGPRIVLHWTNQSDLVINTGVMSSRAKIKTSQKGIVTTNEVVLDDHYIQYSPYASPWKGIENYIRPNLVRYSEDQHAALCGKWGQWPRASTWASLLEFRRAPKGWEFWVDGCYAYLAGTNDLLRGITLMLPAGAAMSEPNSGRNEYAGSYVPLNMAHIARPSGMQDAELTLAGGSSSLNGIPVAPAAKGASADIGRVKACAGLVNLETDQDVSRSPLDGMPEHLHYSVPLAQYIRAWVLCAVEDTPVKDPLLTARLTRFCPSGRGEAIADTTIRLPRGSEAPGAGIRSVGSVSYVTNGTSVTVPLWWCEIPLKVGEIQDLVFDERMGVLPLKGEYLDFEFLGKVGEYADGTIRHKPDPTSVSAVHVFAVTLEKSPVEMDVRKTQVANMFANDERPETRVLLRPRSDFDGSLAWSIRDIDGKVIRTGGERLHLAANGPEQAVAVPLAMDELGWYGLDLTLADRRGRELIKHPASFVLLGPDTRQAGYDSPYMSWWFGWAHGGTADPAIGGTMLQKMGVRRTTLGWHDKDICESNLAPWKLTLSQIGWMGRFYRTNDWVGGAQQQEAAVRALREKFPHCTTALLFHEGYAYYLPPELRDATLTPEEAAPSENDKRLLKLANTVAGVYREKFPEIKIQLGNSSHSCSLVAMLLRNKFPRELFDCVGLETVGQTVPPENSVMTEAWMARETARKFGVEVPVSACFEFTARDLRKLGPRRHAEWKIRDALISHGMGFADIALPGLWDPGDCYYNDSTYGSGGACQRYPLSYPRPDVPAAATLTKVLDQARLRRRVPTGSLSLFALEFERGTDTVYALWVPRGEAAVTMEFGTDGVLTVTDLYGRSRTAKTRRGRIDLAVTTAPQYVIGSLADAKVTAGARTFPEQQPPANQQVASRMDNMREWELRVGRDYRVHEPDSKRWPFLTNGVFEARQVIDAEKGACIEVELIPKGRLPDLMYEYCGLRLKDAPELKGEPNTVGLWVKGNSSRGRILFEFQDAQGEEWLSNGTYLDWPGNLCLNFDGWCFITFPISSKSKVKALSAGGESGQWVGSDDGTVQYPIRLTGLVVEFPRKAINLKEIEAVQPTIRLRDLSAWQ